MQKGGELDAMGAQRVLNGYLMRKNPGAPAWLLE